MVYMVGTVGMVIGAMLCVVVRLPVAWPCFVGRGGELR